MGPFLVYRIALRRWVIDDLAMDYGGFATVDGRRRFIAYVTIVIIQTITVPVFKPYVPKIASFDEIRFITLIERCIAPTKISNARN